MPGLKHRHRPHFAWVACILFAQMAVDVGVAAEELAIVRAKQPLPDAAIHVLAKEAAPITLTRSQYPDAPKFSVRQIVVALCGSFRAAYWNELIQRNEALRGVDIEKAVGAIAYQIKWPACAYVQTKPVTHRVKEGDTAAAVYEQFTGSSGSPKSIGKFFSSSSNVDIAKLQVGEVLSGSHFTWATTVVPKGNSDVLTESLTRALPTAPANYITVDDVPASTQQSNPRIALFANEGAIVAGQYKNPSECASASAPLDVHRIRAAYTEAQKRTRAAHLDLSGANVVVVDNGFFGARLDSARGLVFGKPFPPRFFYDSSVYADGQLGPLVDIPGSTAIYPINYSNGLSKADVTSGHGTHLVGIVMGGPAFQDQLAVFDRPSGDSWLHISILNIGKGSGELVPGSERAIQTKLELSANRIVNMSLIYSDSATVRELFRSLFQRANTNLFVVAAGNEHQDDVAAVPYYPASYGGPSSDNVIAIAAHRADGALAQFTNRGQATVELAAPGCAITSWIDDAATEQAVSGTSQAAAWVTFASALLKSLGEPMPAEVKRRLIISGTLLASAANAPPIEQVVSRSRLDVAKALYLFDDYVRYRVEGEAVAREYLGSLVQMSGVGCNGTTAADSADLWALKGTTGGFIAFRGKKAMNYPSLCTAKTDQNAKLFFKPRMRVSPDGSLTEDNGALVEISLGSLEEFVSRTPPVKQ